ncbi:MAG TPA: hypothetical protein VKE51_04965 [Vicinamibacterales bacterium]|nr:hypothetical protein [Vicinamibacterales bacterium]
MRIVFALWFLAHGVGHLPGFLVSWQLRDFAGLPFHTTVLAGSVDVGAVGIRVIGVGWLLAALAFALLAAATILRVEWWHQAAYVVLGFSVMLCVLGWPRAWIGLTSNIVVAVVLLAAGRFGWA